MGEEKFDFTKQIKGLTDNIKSMINPGGGTPNVDPSDAMGVKIAKITTMLTELANSEKETAKKFSELNSLMNDVFQDLETIRNPAKKEPKNKA
ncbi:MAG: hypothetical protein A3I77_05505 [Gammaproteobacteria bacterium RIFCSPLOWO2_02_FULL_42_14]|nr:MAG: hypothetical protein A3B71_00610 [Gammaproteobacteria bacterium RIFCSPHIGHO2_02_FULL_42_43]OGT27911.1 MAG: hypothetical protein A2624_03300 [Gammaproteobacteria bacterium RIFCSPHIGHO2_01_FULL_42_8]OGT53656.1 MAG: hypothetical protein A3E54_00245 [Gammaproteobacteria bacterium RIFCSPHIGHO2_12_FULL_41_25]OGT62721.1 MAG: hypothetical protein A3I77_05505 [Gammaproteobacteria bacterium RIFCSPLOWO2_02_FULL_42_14]OGT85618.1 MAG: hypothetical protein A3G86_02395 [Gammaproteobacteria bacterium R